ncbi:MAG: cysteine desulfurase [Candidatus Margulisbacteria bacterium]|nr:cysteine desulfurase [Candidatus Margulisiibacteriota bacterium]
MENKKIYCDHIAAKPLLPEVIEAVNDCQKNIYGNPSSLHDFGQAAKKKLDEARSQIATLISAQPEEIIFTASGSEANSLALKGIANAYANKGKHIVTSVIEHFSVLHPLKALEKEGFKITQIPVDKNGLVDLSKLKEAITNETILVSIMLAHSEVGTIEPIKEINKIVKEKNKNAILHTDAISAVGNIPVSVTDLGIDALSFSGNQFCGPLGAAGLFLRKGVRLIPQIEGGIQESGKRAGTENLPAIVGLGKAAEVARNDLSVRAEKLTNLSKKLINGLKEKIDNIYPTGDTENRLPGHASFCVEFIEGEGMLLFLNAEGIAVASGSACTSLALKASHVLLAMGVDAALAQGSIVFSLGIENTEEDIDYIIEKFQPIIKRLREMSPLYNK